MTEIVATDDLCFRYPRAGGAGRSGSPWAIEGVDYSVTRGSIAGIVGESGSGKSTLIRVLCGLLSPTQGRVSFAGREILDWQRHARREFQQKNQIIFQNPAKSFDPRMRLKRALSEPVRATQRRKPSEAELVDALEEVGLSGDFLRRFPHEMSGGQLQRVAIARALLVRPSVLYADEPTSSLDVSVQAQVLNLLLDLRARRDLTVVLVSHDLAVVARVCDRIMVMRNGKMMEHSATPDIIRQPQSEYTANLLQSARAVSLAAG